MATPYIVVGCPTTGGGQVISGNNSFLIEGIPIACVGDKATCPKHKTVATIITGDPYMQVLGKAAARVNDSLSCGCKLLPKQNLAVSDTGPGIGAGSSNQNQQTAVKTKQYSGQYQLLNEIDGAPMANVQYNIKYPDGRIIEGTTDAEGFTQKLAETDQADQIEITLAERESW
ncbi:MULTISPECIES: PAAR domain-containing protein [unclassified Acinetobacter]|uniref:PAAR domain-containing protein n=1 Tax=unclassified Acinetobacter TaxID=196816 RepID=UPI00124F3DFA|nr:MULTISPECIES: PAAR domain-containing protein [unclassified Acinetobacter]